MPKKRDMEATIKTSVEMPVELWRRVRHRAIDEGAKSRQILIRALEAYLATPVKPNLPKGGRHAR
jgi:hypothetical protein